MRKLDVSSITDVSQMKIKQGTLQFLQDANAEAFASILIGLIGSSYNPATVYIIYGCQNSSGGSVYTISAGAAFYAGEIFLVPAQAFTVTGSDVPVFTILITQYLINADPVTFSDATVRNVHNIRQLLIAAAAAGSGIANYSAASFLDFTIPAQVSLGGAGVTGAYPNYNIPGPNGLNPILAAGSVNVGNVYVSGGVDVAIVFGSALSTGNFYVQGTIISQGTPDNDSIVGWSVRSRTNAGFTVHFKALENVATNIAFDWIVFSK